jgi:hypothetical protein
MFAVQYRWQHGPRSSSDKATTRFEHDLLAENNPKGNPSGLIFYSELKNNK